MQCTTKNNQDFPNMPSMKFLFFGWKRTMSSHKILAYPNHPKYTVDERTKEK